MTAAAADDEPLLEALAKIERMYAVEVIEDKVGARRRAIEDVLVILRPFGSTLAQPVGLTSDDWVRGLRAWSEARETEPQFDNEVKRDEP